MSRRSRIWISVVGVLAVVVVWGLTVWGQLPPSLKAPKVGEKAPEFTLPDTNEKPVKLTELLAGPEGGPRPAGVLLIFYRGYW